MAKTQLKAGLTMKAGLAMKAGLTMKPRTRWLVPEQYFRSAY